MKNGLEGTYIIKDNKKLRFGYTTGSCAAAAAKAAAQMLFSGKQIDVVDLLTPKGILLHLEPVCISFSEGKVSCAIQKEAGDDPDVTNQIRIFASAETCSRAEAERLIRTFESNPDSVLDEKTGEQRKAIRTGKGSDLQEERNSESDVLVGITSGIGVGKVTLPGLEQPVGAPAINRVPRGMITEEVTSVCQRYGYTGGMKITVWAPEGAETAKRTFNPRLGIAGGISILGTSGIVEPMSEQALVASIQLEMRQKTSGGQKYLLVTPGNYGTQYLKDHFPFSPEEAVKCSNFVGQTIDYAVNMELSGLLFVAHIGKFVKLAGGIMNTHSKDADARMEILASCALRAGADGETARKILDCVTTDEGLRVLQGTDLWDETIRILMEKIAFYLQNRCGKRLLTGAIVFSNVFGELGRTKDAEALLNDLVREKAKKDLP